MNLLDEIFLKYGTDKSSKTHNYAPVYHNAFHPIRNEVRKVLEIGIFGTSPDNAGASLKSWVEYFPNALVFGVDQFDYSFLDSGRIRTIVADQGVISGNLERVAAIVGDGIDIIIDDGSHLMHHQQISLGYLFRFLKPGGCYVIEDLQTAYHAICNPTGTQYDTVTMLEILRHTGTLVSDRISEDDRHYIEQWVASCSIHKVVPYASETALLWKQTTPGP